MTYNTQRSLELLRFGTGRTDVVFREGQEHAIRHCRRSREAAPGAKDRLGEKFCLFHCHQTLA